ncbi:MAG: glycosyltransferase [Comamonadaceae bacterium]|nr:glycosyltransferase [Comamonadaceae bacterium]
MTPPSLQPTAPFWLVVPTYNPGQAVWSEWIRALQMQTVQPQRVVVVDSGSTDGTQQLSQQAGFLGLSVAAQNFNHGGTRQWALDQALAAHTQTPPTQSPPTWVVYLTQDAILANPQSLQNLLQAFQDERVAGVYGRQMPHPHASWMETHARHFNYPATSKTVTVQDKESMGLKVCFFSDAFSAYRLSALQQQGGFPRHVPLGEDTLMAAKLLLAGHSLRYEAQASTLGLEKHLAQLKAKAGAMPEIKWPF